MPRNLPRFSQWMSRQRNLVASRPRWAHVPKRVWRRNSALLTYLHDG